MPFWNDILTSIYSAVFLCDVYFVLVVVHGIFLKELDLKNKLIHVYSLLAGIANWLQRYTYCFFGLLFYVFHTYNRTQKTLLDRQYKNVASQQLYPDASPVGNSLWVASNINNSTNDDAVFQSSEGRFKPLVDCRVWATHGLLKVCWTIGLSRLQRWRPGKGEATFASRSSSTPPAGGRCALSTRSCWPTPCSHPSRCSPQCSTSWSSSLLLTLGAVDAGSL